MPRRVLLFAALAWGAAPVPVARAHHSTAPYDLIHGTAIEGVVTEFAWENPHAHIYVDASAGEHWTIEMDGPGVLRRLGWTKDRVKAGDRIIVSGARAKNGSFYLKALTVQLPDGRTLRATKIEN